MRFVQLPPACLDAGFVAQLCCRRRASERNQGRIGSIAKIQQFGVDPLTLYRGPSAR